MSFFESVMLMTKLEVPKAEDEWGTSESSIFVLQTRPSTLFSSSDGVGSTSLNKDVVGPKLGKGEADWFFIMTPASESAIPSR